jgi:hypothetical protein
MRHLSVSLGVLLLATDMWQPARAQDTTRVGRFAVVDLSPDSQYGCHA